MVALQLLVAPLHSYHYGHSHVHWLRAYLSQVWHGINPMAIFLQQAMEASNSVMHRVIDTVVPFTVSVSLLCQKLPPHPPPPPLRPLHFLQALASSFSGHWRIQLIRRRCSTHDHRLPVLISPMNI